MKEAHNTNLNFLKGHFKHRTCEVELGLLKQLINESFVIPEKYFSARMQVEENEEESDEEITPVSAETIAKLDYLKSKFDSAVDEFDAIFIKIEGKAPKNMENWVPELQFKTFEDLLMAIKYSEELNDHISQLNNPIVTLLFKKWYKLNPAMEFRCFVYENQLKGKINSHHSKKSRELLSIPTLPIRRKIKA